MTDNGPVTAACPHHASGACRSCPHQDLPVAEQLADKQARVARLLTAVPDDAWLPPVPSAPTRFRNKAKMVVSGTSTHPVLGVLGPDGVGTDLRDCPLHVEEIERALPVLARTITRLGLEPYDVARRRGELKHLLVTASPDGDLMVRWVLRSHHHLPALRADLPRLRRELETLAVMSANIQPVHQAVIEGEEEVLLTREPGADRVLMRLRLPGADGAGRELALLLPTRSFFQTNTAVAERLYATASAWAEDVAPARAGEPVRVWDLFCGVGGFALALAGAGRRVHGVEVSAPAIEGARAAAALMGLDEQDVSFEAGDARVLDPTGARALGGVPDLLVLNPPRRGIGADLAGRVAASGVRRLLYSSCHPASLARDLALMGPLRVRRAQVFDMFPHTDHAEVLVDLVHG
ncbi:methyltransferase domain-containing protein [Actinomyces sp. 186855]|nr:methyltransferase domain-containing protein [Actinomyces sp. AC-20-1]MCL3789415.1 methyltransferase domain-containing protein [Actinomyces sp. 187325]MCL3791728.1 methyltransferase domain-containing protein [Actinomyces sp. 186855]MCL3794380.1 methyltransferase domain-containing protein [Actinomyces sp. 217892]